MRADFGIKIEDRRAGQVVGKESGAVSRESGGSGLGRETVVNAFLSSLGIVRFLQKPFAMRSVLELIEAQGHLRANAALHE